MVVQIDRALRSGDAPCVPRWATIWLSRSKWRPPASSRPSAEECAQEKMLIGTRGCVFLASRQLFPQTADGAARLRQAQGKLLNPIATLRSCSQADQRVEHDSE